MQRSAENGVPPPCRDRRRETYGICSYTNEKPHILTPMNRLALFLYNRTRRFSGSDSFGLPTLDAFPWVRDDLRKFLRLSDEQVADLTRRVSLIHSYFYPDEIARIHQARQSALK